MTAIESFLASKRLAFFGVSRNPKEFSRLLYREFRVRGYEVLPVHPEAAEIDGVPCFPKVSEVSPAPDAAMLMLPKHRLEEAVRDCADAGVRKVWAYGISGVKDVPENVNKLAKERGLEFVAGSCPYMFLPDASVLHRFHGWIWKKLGKIPTAE